MAIRAPIHRGKPEINLNGPEGNAFVLLRYAQRLGKQLGFTPDQLNEVHEEMISSDYEHLIKTFDAHFGDYIDLVRVTNFQK